MENLKKILNAQTRVFGNFQFLQHMVRNHLGRVAGIGPVPRLELCCHL